MLHPRPGPHPVHTIHRIGALIIGAFLVLFGGLGLAIGLPMLSNTGVMVLGLSSNGLLAGLSVVVGAILIGSAIRGGHTASNISIGLGGLFLLSGLVNTVLLGTSLNLLAFRASNIAFSFVVGAILLITGAYGRIAGHLPLDSPYHREVAGDPASSGLTNLADRARDLAARALDLAAAAELAEAERAHSLHYATADQLKRLTAVRQYRSSEDRQRAWRESAVPVPTRANASSANPPPAN
jgi:hypothetical protein